MACTCAREDEAPELEPEDVLQRTYNVRQGRLCCELCFAMHENLTDGEKAGRPVCVADILLLHSVTACVFCVRCSLRPCCLPSPQPRTVSSR
jgi:hypothetical protein